MKPPESFNRTNCDLPVCPYCGDELDCAHLSHLGVKADDRTYKVNCDDCGRDYDFTTAVTYTSTKIEAQSEDIKARLIAALRAEVLLCEKTNLGRNRKDNCLATIAHLESGRVKWQHVIRSLIIQSPRFEGHSIEIITILVA